jgi:serine/threonine-protein kinase
MSLARSAASPRSSARFGDSVALGRRLRLAANGGDELSIGLSGVAAMGYPAPVSRAGTLDRVGTTLRDKYTLDALIGVGGMAAVYRGAHRNGNRVAVKLLHAELSVHADIRARFLKEGYVANSVDHPGVVRVLDDDVTEDGVVFLVMELLEGKTLGEMAERAHRQLPPQEVAGYAAQLLAVLAVAHQRGIVHRDIKPENLFVTRERVLKVLDFGIARMRDANTTSATRTGSMMGTPAYMAREQVLGLSKEIDGRTDLWAVGATMFKLISGKYVHEAETPESMMVFSATRPARPLATVALDVPAPLCAVVDRALAFNKADRYLDAPTMLAALEAACRASFGAPPADVRGSGPPAPAAASPPLVAPGAMGAMGAPAPPPPTAAPIAHGPFGQQSPLASSAYAGPGAGPSFALRAGSGVAPGPAGFAAPGVSTTAGVSGLPRARAVDGPLPPTLFTPPMPTAPSPPRVGKAAAILAGVAVVLALLASVSVGLKYRAQAKAASATSAQVAAPPEAPSSSARAVEPPSATAATAVTEAPTPAVPVLAHVAPNASAIASTAPASEPSAGTVAATADAAAKTPAATPLPAKRRDPAPATPPAVAPVAPDCNPPVYFDPVTGKKKVKPGC